MSDVVTKIGFEVDEASVGDVKSAAAAVSAEIDRVGKNDVFAGLVKDFKDVGAQIQNDEFALAALREELVKLNASDAEIASATAAFLGQSEAIDKAAESATKLAEAEAQVADKAQTAGKALADEAQTAATSPSPSAGGGLQSFRDTQAQIAPVGASVGALRAIGRAAGTAGATGVQGAANSAAEVLELTKSFTQLKAAAAALPDSLSAIGQAFGLAKSASDTAAAATGAVTAATETAAAAEAVQAAATGGVALTSGGAAAGLAAMLIPLLPIAAVALAVAGGVALLAAAVGDLQKKSQEAAEAIKTRYAAEDKVDALVRSGATIEEAYKQRADLEAKVADATRRGNEAQAEKDATFANDAKASGDPVARLRGGNAVYKEFDDRIKSTQVSATQASAELAELNKQIDGGSFAAATAKEKAQSDAAVKEKAANEAAQAQEKAAREAEQAAAKQQQAQEKAAQEAQQQAEKVKQAQEQIAKSNQDYSNKLTDLATTAAQRVIDINQGARDKASDALLKYNDDLATIALKARRDDVASRAKAAQDDAAEVVKQARALDDIKSDVAKNERDALRQRNFLAASLAQETGQESFDKAALTAKRAAEDQAAAEQNEAAKRLLDLQQARQDRLNAYQLDNRDASTALKRQLREADTNQRRQEAQAQTAHEREQAQYAEHLQALVGIRTAGFAAEASAAQGRSPDTSALQTANGGTSNTTTINDHRSLGITGSFGGLLTVDVLQKMALKTFQRVSY